MLDREGRVAASILGDAAQPTTLASTSSTTSSSDRRAMGDWFRDAATSGSLLLAVPVALLAGLVSFFSPCVIPLLPGYLSYATGLSGADLADARRGRMLAGSLLFVLGFSVRLRRPRRAVGRRRRSGCSAYQRADHRRARHA